MKPSLALAPIQGITEKIYRNLFSNHFGGFDSALAPFVDLSKGNYSDKKIHREFEPKQDWIPTIPQILSKDWEDFVQLANIFFDLGYPTINWNLGCPHSVVVSRNKGSGLLKHPELIDSFLNEALLRIKGKLSIKMRLGYESSNEIFKLIPILNRYPITEIIIHARTGKQMYSGKPDRETFEQCISLMKHTLVYNGDINTIEDFREISRRFPTLKKWMIGRGALKNPFLPGEIGGKTTLSRENQIKKINLFHQELFKEYSNLLSGPAHILQKMIGHWEYLSEFFPNGSRIFRKLKKVKKLEEYQEQIKRIFCL